MSSRVVAELIRLRPLITYLTGDDYLTQRLAPRTDNYELFFLK